MANIWGKGIERSPILDKYQIALNLAHKDIFIEGGLPYQYVKDLIDLRNALIHYKPEWINSDSEYNKPHKFTKRFEDKFLPSPFSGPNSSFYPDKLFGFGCAKWSVEWSITFVDKFFKKMGLRPTYEHIREQLTV